MTETPDAGRDRRVVRTRARRRILSGTAALPSMITLGNGLAGFAAIYFATRSLPGEPTAAAGLLADNLLAAAWLILAGMVCDSLDGQIARLTRRASDFGTQLDSLCDAITFGVAPALLMLRTVQDVLLPYLGGPETLPQVVYAGRAVWFIAATYASCAILRLARFNVETKPDVQNHMSFRGLPSPAGALSVVSLVLVHLHLKHDFGDWRDAPWLPLTVIWALPVVTLSAAILMVSRLHYTHVVNRQLRGRRPFGHIVRLTVAVLAAIVIDFQIILAAAALVYLASAPLAWLVRLIFRRPLRPKPATA